MKYSLRLLTGLWFCCSALNSYAAVFFTEAEAQSALFPNRQLVQHEIHVDTPLLKEIRKRTSARLITSSLKVWKAIEGQQPTGWLFNAEVLGKHENIRYALAIDTNGNILGMEVMEYRETHGGEVAEAGWRSQFYGKSLSDRLKLGGDIDNITGATLSCRHLVDGIHGLLIIHDRLLRNH